MVIRRLSGNLRFWDKNQLAKRQFSRNGGCISTVLRINASRFASIRASRGYYRSHIAAHFVTDLVIEGQLWCVGCHELPKGARQCEDVYKALLAVSAAWHTSENR